jgi:hypothetical protein
MSVRTHTLAVVAAAGILSAVLPSPASSQARQFDGVWKITHKSANCMVKSGGYTISIANGRVRGGANSGTVSPSGAIAWTRPAGLDGAPVTWEGRLSGNGGSGTYVRADGKCRGVFKLQRNR